jgi:hypothetical protein
VLHSIRSEHAPLWEAELEDYRECFQQAMRQAIERSGTWDCEGEKVPHIPSELTRLPLNTDHPFTLDTGPLFLAIAGLVDADSSWITDSLRWFAQGPHLKGWADDRKPYCSQKPCLVHEISSCEPCYSWNIDARFLRNELNEFLEGFYSLCAGARSRRLPAGMETRHGVFGLPCVGSALFAHLRNMLVYESGEGLEYLRAIPRAWLAAGSELCVRDLPTYFGPTGVEWTSALPDGPLTINVHLPKRDGPAFARVRLGAHLDRITRVEVAGAPAELDPEGWVAVPVEGEKVELVVRVAQ